MNLMNGLFNVELLKEIRFAQSHFSHFEKMNAWRMILIQQ